MVVRLTATREPLRLTQDNHPENAARPAKGPMVSLASMIGISALCGLVGMTFGSAALSTAFKSDTAGEVLSLIPLIATGTCILSGWVGAFYWMIRDESQRNEASG